jgi:hypothetical protein
MFNYCRFTIDEQFKNIIHQVMHFNSYVKVIAISSNNICLTRKTNINRIVEVIHLKKILLIIMLILLSFLYPLKSMAYFDNNQSGKPIPESIAPLSKERVLQVYIGDITSKYTTEIITEHYGMNIPYQLEDAKVVDAKLIYGTNKVDYIFKVQVQPFLGAHDHVGTDEFTYRISGSEIPQIKLLKYEHIESFLLPPHVKSHYKNLKQNY